MYSRLEDNKTKKYYKKVLDETIIMVDHIRLKSSNPMFVNICNQLKDIQENVVIHQTYFGWEQINNHYSLGAIATKNFDEGEELRDRLFDIFWGAIDFKHFPEE